MIEIIHASPYAGRWYPADASELRELIAEALEKSITRTGSFVRKGGVGFVVPHAAPVYSGRVAAAAYRLIAESRPRRIVLLGFSHRRGVHGIAVPQVESISTPLGSSEIDLELARALVREAPFHPSPEAALCDHSVEIQLPFLQTVAPGARVLPLYIGHLSGEQRAGAAARLRELMEEGAVLLASSDLTHYGREFGYLPFPVGERTGERLKALDLGVAAAAGSLDAGMFLDELRRTGSTVCGSEPIALLLKTLAGSRASEIFQEVLDYQTSGEIESDYEHSVSYGAFGYFPYRAFLLGEEEQRALLESARRTIEQLQAEGRRQAIEPERLPGLTQRLAAFVTLYQRGELQGCIGRCFDPESLERSVPDLTLSAALEDSRFAPLRRSEPVEIEISVLSPFKRISRPEQLLAGEHGALLEAGSRSGLLLPKVASERAWNTGQFLNALAQKAGVKRDVYNQADARVSVFRAQVFGDRAK